MRKILVHMCCAPCATYVNKWLRQNGFDLRDFFYNPNIRPQIEFERRVLTAKHYGAKAGFKVICENNDQETTPGECETCYRVRLRRTAQLAKDLYFDCFTTTLLISPYQDQALLRKVAEEAAKEFGIEFFDHDFRDGYRESRRMAKEMKLYMQKYCGCGKESVLKKEKAHAQAD